MAASRIALTGLAVALVGGLIAFGAISSCQSNPPVTVIPPEPVAPDPRAETVEVVIKGRTFNLELALTSAQRYQGLSDRKAIADDGGMVFAFRYPQELGFVMRRCYVPIDIIYLDGDGRVVNAYQMQVIEPIGGLRWQNPIGSPYPSNGLAQFAVEIKGGLLDELNVKPGDLVELPREELKRRAQ